MTQANRLQKIEEGKIASSIESFAGAYITDKITQHVKLLTAAWRAGDLSHDKMVGIIGGISALEEMIADLGSIQRQAYIAAQKEFGDGKET
jgi:hypothetical protein